MDHSGHRQDEQKGPSMRTLAVTQNITVDGSIEFLGDWFDPQGEDEDTSDILEHLQREDRDTDAILLGRRTFEDFRSYWPHQTDDKTGITEQLNNVQKYVVSTTMTDPAWQNSTVLSGDVIGGIQALKQQPGKDIVLTGSITLCHAVIKAGLADQFRLFVYPVVQGRGRRLFPEGHQETALDLLETRIFRSGVVYMRYRPVP
jgi:dihydrofolate reductase